MADISTLLREARPLYFQRKQRRRRLKAMAGTLGCAALVGFITIRPAYVAQSEALYAYLYQLETETESVFSLGEDPADSLFPLDEYGLVTVG